MQPPSPTPPRQRGRPKLTADDLKANQDQVLIAASRLFQIYHSTQLSVEILIGEANISRASFYRWFPKGMEEVLDRIIFDTNQALISSVLETVQQANTPEDRIRRSIRAYFEWAKKYHLVVTGLYREAFDKNTAACRYRLNTIKMVVDIVMFQVQHLNIKGVDEILVETLILWVETASMVIFRGGLLDDDTVLRQSELTTDLFLLLFNEMQNRGVFNISNNSHG
jgi:TetR/AcrR family transcriptional regulator